MIDLSIPVKKIMRRDVNAVDAEDSLLDVQNVFSHFACTHVPVCHRESFIGLLSKSDFQLFAHGFRTNKKDEVLDLFRLKSHHVKDIMNVPAITLSPESTLQEAMQIFTQKCISILSITERDTILGLLSPLDILAYLFPNESRKSANNE